MANIDQELSSGGSIKYTDSNNEEVIIGKKITILTIINIYPLVRSLVILVILK